MPPPEGLAATVASLWSDTPLTSRTQRVLPDGCMDLLCSAGEVRVAGPDTAAYLTEVPAGSRVLAVRFRPGAAPGVLGVPADALRDQRVPLAELWGRAATERIAAADDPAGALLNAVRARRPAPDPTLRVVLARLRAGAGVAATADALGWTERTLHRRCLAAFGYGPAVLRRILRFRAAVRLLGRGVPPAETAARTGYADQPHLSREVRALAGVAPGQLSGANRSTPLPSGSSTVA